MRFGWLYVFPVFPLFLLCHCASPGGVIWDSHDTSGADSRLQALVTRVNTCMARGRTPLKTLLVTSPYDMALFPPDIAAPTVTWRDGDARSRFWLISVVFDNGRKPVYAFVREPEWTPDRTTWKTIKVNSVLAPVILSVFGLADENADVVASVGSVSFSTCSGVRAGNNGK